MSRLVVMGSGETAPTMVRTHRAVLAGTFEGEPPAAGTALALDTTFGFQDNADELVAKTLQYFVQSVGHPVEVATWRRADAPTVDAERTLARLGRARWLFAGPGSPTYALRHWRGTGVAAAMTDVVARGGTLVVGSAAACTIGSHAVPVYEIYKAGRRPGLGRRAGRARLRRPASGPRWCRTSTTPRAAATTPGTATSARPGCTRWRPCCPRTSACWGSTSTPPCSSTPPPAPRPSAGNGVVTLRYRDRRSWSSRPGARWRRGGSPTWSPAVGHAEPGAAPPAPDGSVVHGAPVARPSAVDRQHRRRGPAAAQATSLRAAVDAERDRFDAAMQARDVETAVACALADGAGDDDWSGDTLAERRPRPRPRVLRAMLVRLGELAVTGAADPREVVGGYVELLLASCAPRPARPRTSPPATECATPSPRLGVEVRDSPGGASWVMTERSRPDAPAPARTLPPGRGHPAAEPLTSYPTTTGAWSLNRAS